MKSQLKQKWDEITSDIEKLEDWLDELKNKIRQTEINIDHSPQLDVIVEGWLDSVRGAKIPYYPSPDEPEEFDALLETCEEIADWQVEEFDYYFANDDEDELKSGQAREWFIETIMYNVTMMSLLKSIPAIEKQIEKMYDERKQIIKPYLAAYENACDDLYYGYGYNTWYSGTEYVDGAKKYFDIEEDAKFIWHLAFEKMSNEE